MREGKVHMKLDENQANQKRNKKKKKVCGDSFSPWKPCPKDSHAPYRACSAGINRSQSG